MYYNKKARNEMSVFIGRQVAVERKEIYNKNSIGQKERIVTYTAKLDIAINAFVAKLVVKYDKSGKVIEAFFEDKNSNITAIKQPKFNEIMEGNNPNIRVTKHGYIIAFNEKRLMVTLNFSSCFQIINIFEFEQYRKIKCKLVDVKDEKLIFLDNKKSKIEVPFSIISDFTSQSPVFLLCIEGE